VADLLEAEGRALRRSVFRSGAGLALLVGATVLGLVGIGFCLFGAYLALGKLFGPVTGALLTGLLSLLLTLVVAWIATRLGH
jgi:hypothetical protein